MASKPVSKAPSRRLAACGAFLAAAASVAVIGVAGCGGGAGDDGATAKDSPPTPSKAEFVAKANAACEEERAGLSDKIAEFERRRDGRPSAPGADMVHFIFLPTIERQIFRMMQLGVPPGETGRIDVLLDAQQFGVDAVAVIRRVPTVAAAVKHFGKANRILRAYGLDSCVIASPRAG